MVNLHPLSIIILIVGLIVLIFARRFGIWLMGFVFEYKLMWASEEFYSLSKQQHLQRMTKKNGFPKVYWHVWLTLIRIFGLMLVIGGLFFIFGDVFFS